MMAAKTARECTTTLLVVYCLDFASDEKRKEEEADEGNAEKSKEITKRVQENS